MAIYELPNVTSGGPDQLLIDSVTAVPTFIPMLLFFIFGVIFLGGVTSQKKRLGYADLPMWATTASMSTLMVAVIFSFKAGLIGSYVLSMVAVITIVSGIWLFLDRGRGEV